MPPPGRERAAPYAPSLPSRWCPNCGAEYREGFAECADCDVALVDTPPARPEPHNHEPVAVHGPFLPEDDTVELMRTNRVLRRSDRGRLRSEGIPAVVFDDGAYGSGPFLTNGRGVRVMVRRGDLLAADALAAEDS